MTVYVNHRPAFGLSPFELHEGFTKLGTPGDEGFAIDRDRLLALLQNKGKMYGLLTKCEVKMAGYWPSSFFACLSTETQSRSINSQKRMRPISSHLDRTNLVNKGFIIWLLGKFFLRDTAGSPERAR